MRNLIFILLGILFLGIQSCSKEERDDNQDDMISLNVFEEIQENGVRKLLLDLRTKKIYPCVNFFLNTVSSFSGDRYSLSIKEVIAPEICLTALGPARASIDWSYRDNGIYPITIDAFGKDNTGTLTVEDHVYTLHFSALRNIELVHDKLFKIPENTIWGTVGYFEKDAEEHIAAFFRELRGIGATELKLMPGYYGYFDVDANGEMVIPEFHGSRFAKSLLCTFNGNSDELHALVRKYGNDFPGITSVSVSSASGENFYGYN